MPEGPLSGVTVLDLCQAIAGPTATVLLADFGADVVSIEPPGGGTEREFARGSALPNVSRNKRSVSLDLKTEDGQALLHDMVAEADALVHNNRPGKMADLDADYETLSAINPRLVYCSITGYGETGPYSERPGFDPMAQGVSGLMSMTGEPDRKPSRVGASTIDIGTGIYAAFATVMALRHAEATGEGQKIETSLIDTAAAYMGQWYTYYSLEGRVPTRQGHSWEAYAPAGIVETATGPVYLAAPFQHLWERLCEAVDHEEWITDPRFETDDDRVENREALFAEMEAAFAAFDRSEVIDRLLAAGVPVSEVQTVEEAVTDEHLRQRGAVRELADVDGSPVLAAGPPIRMSETPAEIERGPPELGADNREVLREFGCDEAEIERLIEAGVVDDG